MNPIPAAVPPKSGCPSKRPTTRKKKIDTQPTRLAMMRVGESSAGSLGEE
jgi:hypothetical protein